MVLGSGRFGMVLINLTLTTYSIVVNILLQNVNFLHNVLHIVRLKFIFHYFRFITIIRLIFAHPLVNKRRNGFYWKPGMSSLKY